MRTIQLSTRNLNVPRLFFGTLTMGPLQKNLPVSLGAELLCYAAERGVNFVDTAESYHTYPYIKEALRQKADLAICTKSYAYDAEGAKISLAAAQEETGKETIDIFLLHEQESALTIRGHEKALAYYALMREKGVIGAVGISTHHIAAVHAALQWPEIDVVFPIINYRGLGIVDGTRYAMENAIKKAHSRGLLVLAMKALGGGHLIAERHLAYQYIRDMPGIDAIAVGMQTKEEIDYNIAIFSNAAPSPRVAEATARAGRKLIIQDWCVGCGRCLSRCSQRALSLKNNQATVDSEKCVCCSYCAAVCPQFCIKVV